MSSRLPKAVAAGYAVACCLAIAATQGARLLFPLEGHESPPTGYLALAVAGCFIASVIAAYVAARLAPRGKVFAALAFLVLTFATTAVAISRLAPHSIRPPVVLPLTTMLAVMGALSGAMIERAIYGRRESQSTTHN